MNLEKDTIFGQCAPDDTACFVYDKIDQKWKTTWCNDPERYIGYKQLTDKMLSVFDIDVIIYPLNYNNMPPLDTIIQKA